RSRIIARSNSANTPINRIWPRVRAREKFARLSPRPIFSLAGPFRSPPSPVAPSPLGPPSLSRRDVARMPLRPRLGRVRAFFLVGRCSDRLSPPGAQRLLRWFSLMAGLLLHRYVISKCVMLTPFAHRFNFHCVTALADLIL